MTTLLFNLQTDADGIAAEVNEQPTGFYDELRVEVVFIDSKTKEEIFKIYYVNHKDRLNGIRAIVEER